MDTAIVLMAKNPVSGKVKTRLAEKVGNEKALQIYLDLLAKTTSTMHAIKGVDNVIYHSPTIISDAEWIPPNFTHKLQADGNLGNRMYEAFREELQPFKKVVLIGADCAGLQTSHLEKSVKALDHVDVVLGPSEDGGYYLIGLTHAEAELFQNMEWSTSRVFKESLSRIQKLGLSLFMLPQLYDIDHFEDWQRWQNSRAK